MTFFFKLRYRLKHQTYLPPRFSRNYCCFMLKTRYFLCLLLACTALGSWLLPGCKPREEQLTTSGGLAFSVDTVKFDTVFTTIGTVTKRLWVYNRNPKAVSIDLISLDNPSTSPYTLIINGDLKQTATNVLVRGQGQPAAASAGQAAR